MFRGTRAARWSVKMAPGGSRLELLVLGTAVPSRTSPESTPGSHSTSPGSAARSPDNSQDLSTSRTPPLSWTFQQERPERVTSSPCPSLCCCPSLLLSSLSLSSREPHLGWAGQTISWESKDVEKKSYFLIFPLPVSCFYFTKQLAFNQTSAAVS